MLTALLLVLAAADPGWATPAEASDYRVTPTTEEALSYVRRVAAAAPQQVQVQVFGRTGEGRELVSVTVSRDGQLDPAALHRAGRPVVLIQNAIHAGEMDGTDACLALLRDLVVTRTRAALLERAVIVIVPVYNADGHARRSAYNRINQNGPQEAGWRANGRNLNLNRDYMKADAPETRAFLQLWNRWLPDFFIDDHVTDGADYQYDITWGLDDSPHAWGPHVEWEKKSLIPYFEESVARAGHLASAYIALADDTDPAKGLVLFPYSARFATGYTSLQNRPGLLVEMHMLKDYKTRVTGNYELLRAVLEVVNRDADRLVRMNRDADAARPGSVPLRVATDGSEPFRFRGYKYRRSLSEVSGAMRIEYAREPLELTLPRPSRWKVEKAAAPPAAYIVPAQWTQVIEVLAAHGLRLLRTARPWQGEVGAWRCDDLKWQEHPFEGRHPLFEGEGAAGRPGHLGACAAVREQMWFPAGSAVVPMDQRAAKVAVHFLEPEAPDSAVAWGFFDPVFEQREGGEAYVLENLARKMLGEQPALREEFEKRLAADKAFAPSPEARLDFFLRRSPWWDRRIGLLPVGRLSSLQGLPLAE